MGKRTSGSFLPVKMRPIYPMPPAPTAQTNQPISISSAPKKEAAPANEPKSANSPAGSEWSFFPDSTIAQPPRVPEMKMQMMNLAYTPAPLNWMDHVNFNPIVPAGDHLMTGTVNPSLLNTSVPVDLAYGYFHAPPAASKELAPNDRYSPYMLEKHKNSVDSELLLNTHSFSQTIEGNRPEFAEFEQLGKLNADKMKPAEFHHHQHLYDRCQTMAEIPDMHSHLLSAHLEGAFPPFPNERPCGKSRGYRVWQCFVMDCGKAFRSGAGLRYHLSRTHNTITPRALSIRNKPRPWQCEQCNKRFSTAAGLRYHNKTTDHTV